MEFSKVHLDFGKTRLRGLSSLASDAPAGPLDAATSDADGAPPDEAPGMVIAHAPQYTATFSPLTRDAERASYVSCLDYDVSSGYTLAVTPEGVLVWKRGNESTLLFPLPFGHSARALFVAPAAGEPVTQPGLVTLDQAAGTVTYWESVSRAVISGPEAQVDVRVPLDTRAKDAAENERITFVEPLSPIGIALGTSRGKFYVLHLRDSLGRRAPRVLPLQPSNKLLARIRSIGAYSRDTNCVRAGRRLADDESELYIVNMYGDLALWRVGLSGTSALVHEAQIGAMLHMHMNILYPNSVLSLVVHDVAVEDAYTHVLASFAPHHGSPELYFVIATLSRDLEVVSVQRLQAYESLKGGVSDRAALRIAGGVLCAVLDGAVAFLDSPSRTPEGERRWEEAVFFKANAQAIGSASDGHALTVSTPRGFVAFNMQSARSSESTTQARLEQAVFDASPENPLDLSTWFPWEFKPDSDAAKELAVKIANAETSFLPSKLPNLAVHLDLRAEALLKLYDQTLTSEVRDVTQAVVAAAAIWRGYEADAAKIIVDEFASSREMTVQDLFVHRILSIPELTTLLATKSSSDVVAGEILVHVLQAWDSNARGTPEWGFAPEIRLAIEAIAARAADAPDVNALAQTVALLCSVSPPELLESEPSRLILALAKLDRVDEAMDTAKRFKVYSALAAIQISIWCGTVGEERALALDSLRSLIAEFGKPLATAVCDACVAQGHISALIREVAPLDIELAGFIELYLESHEMYSVAWTLEPGTHRSTDLLLKALTQATSVDARQLFASLYKLSALSIGADQAAIEMADRELRLVAVQESLAMQYYGVSTLQSHIARHALAPMTSSKPLYRNDAVDLLALAPPIAPAESNDNFIRAFGLVGPQDLVRQRLLVQQLICNSNWEPVDTARDENRQITALRRTLFVHTMLNVAPAYAAMLANPQPSWFETSSPEEVKESYPWDANSIVYSELSDITQLAESIAQKYNVVKWIGHASSLLEPASAN